MNKLFTFLMTVMVTMTAQAADYTDKLLVLVNGEGSEQQATITVTPHGDLYDLNLKNFILMNGSEPMPVGNVELKDLVPEQAGNAIFLRASQNITVTEGDADGVLFWMGPMLGELPVELTAVIEDDRLRALITLDLMTLMQQMIEVRFGEAMVTGAGYHIPNGDFEAWHTTTGNYVEPNAWHSFESASGSLATLAGHHIERSGQGRNGSACARLFATSIFGIVANGTMTTGRMNAGAMVATDKNNNAYLDMSKTDTDGNGDPFYVPLNSRPDSLVLWVQFKQGTTNAAHPYATVSAVITDGTYYQDPEDKTYDNVVAKAANREISVTNGEWRRVSIPFVYGDNHMQPRAILVTISTNADPGQGSANDEVLVDDLTLVYNSRLSSLAVEGFAPNQYEYELTGDVDVDGLEAQADGQGAYVLKSVEETDNGKRIVVNVYAADLLSHSTYTVNINSASDHIAKTGSVTDAPTYYQLNGMQTTKPRQGQLYIIRQGNGRTVKVRR